jgi:hypothetical protein
MLTTSRQRRPHTISSLTRMTVPSSVSNFFANVSPPRRDHQVVRAGNLVGVWVGSLRNMFPRSATPLCRHGSYHLISWGILQTVAVRWGSDLGWPCSDGSIRCGCGLARHGWRAGATWIARLLARSTRSVGLTTSRGDGPGSSAQRLWTVGSCLV